MKKFLTVISILSLVFCSISGLSEGIDLKSMSDEELIELGLAVREELFVRDEYTDTVLYPGQYVVGDDIEPGKYVMKIERCLPNEKYGIIYAYKSIDDFENDEEYDLEMFHDGDEYYFNLKDGYVIDIGRAVFIYENR